MIERNQAIMEAKSRLHLYLSQKGINTRKNFSCLSPAHTDKKPSMGLLKGGLAVHCLSCGCHMDIFDLVGQDYGLSSFNDQLDKVCELFGIDYQTGKAERKPIRKIPRLSDEEMELLGFHFKSAKRTPYLLKKVSDVKPEDYDSRMVLPHEDGYVVGEAINGSMLWFELQKDRETFEWMVREKCKEKYKSLLGSVVFMEAMVHKHPENETYFELLEAFHDIKNHIIDIYKRFHGKVRFSAAS